MAATGLTAEEVERGYNNRAAVPEHPYWFEQFAIHSQAAADALRPVQDIRYGPGPKETLGARSTSPSTDSSRRPSWPPVTRSPTSTTTFVPT